MTLATRPGVTQSFVILGVEGRKPEAVALLYVGAGGRINLRTEEGQVKFSARNFLPRSGGDFVRNGVLPVVMDAPSDQPGGMDDGFRLGDAHAEDIGKVIADLKKRFPGLPVFLVGTSRGTISAASAGRRLGKEVDGVVLTATLFLASRTQPGLSGFDFSTIPSPLLFVHHVDDGCTYTPYSSARRLADRYPLVSVSGGRPPEAKPCEAMTPHGFLGKEAETVDAMAKWMQKQPHPREIN